VPELAPSNVLVEVLNGSGASGAASQTAQALHGEGFRVNGTGNAGSFSHVENVAEYSAGSEEAASTIAEWVTGGTELVEVRGLAPNEVYLVLGSGFHGLSG
jgi:nucleoside-diphosphate-sugar epimerase